MTERESRVVCVIPVRVSDVRLGDAPIMLAGRHLVDHTIVAAKNARSLSRVVVTTDDEEVAALCRELGADVPFLRPRALANAGIGLDEVVAHVVNRLDPGGSDYDSVVVLEVAHPIRPPDLIDRVVDTLHATELDTVFTAFEERRNFWRAEDDGVLAPLVDLLDTPRRRRSPIWRDVSGLALACRASTARSGSRYGRRVGLVSVTEAYALIDTQDVFGLKMAEGWIRAGGFDQASSASTA